MNSTRPQRPIRKRRGIFYYSPEDEELGPGFYMHMFSEDLAVSIMPIGGRSSRTNFRVTISPDEERAKDIIMTGLKEHGHGHSLADTLYDFFQLVSAYLTTSERAVFEVVYLEEQQTRTLIGFELAAIAETQIVEKRGQFFQCVPPQVAVERNVPEMISLEKENLIIFRPPMEFEKPLRAVKPIGWNARGSFNDSVLSYYWILMSLTFERFKIRLRETMLDTLNAGFERIGEKLGFEARLKIEGLPTLADVDHAIEQLNSGAMPFTEVMKPFELS